MTSKDPKFSSGDLPPQDDHNLMCSEAKPPPRWVPSKEEDPIYQRMFWLMDSYIPTWILTRRPEQASPPWFRAAVKEYLALQKLMRYIDADTAWLLEFEARFAAENNNLLEAQRLKLEAFQTARNYLTHAHPEMKLRSEELDELASAVSVRDKYRWVEYWERRVQKFCHLVIKDEVLFAKLDTNKCLTAYSQRKMQANRTREEITKQEIWEDVQPVVRKRTLADVRIVLAYTNILEERIERDKVYDMTLEEQLAYCGALSMVERDESAPRGWRIIDVERRDSAWAEMGKTYSSRIENDEDRAFERLEERADALKISDVSQDSKETSSTQDGSSSTRTPEVREGMIKAIARLEHLLGYQPSRISSDQADSFGISWQSVVEAQAEEEANAGEEANADEKAHAEDETHAEEVSGADITMESSFSR